MKVLQYAVCGLFLTLTAAGQTAPATPSAPPAAPAKPMQLSTLGGDTVKGSEHPLTLDQMKELYVAMGYDKLLEQNRVAMLSQQKQRAPFIPQDVWDDFDTTSKKVDYPAAFLDVYKKYLSTDDAAKLIAFAKTDAGKHFLENTPELTRETAMALQKQQQQVGQEVQGRHKDEIEAAVKKYQEEHAPKPAPSLGKPTPAPGAAGAPPAAPKPATPAPAQPPANAPAQANPPTPQN